MTVLRPITSFDQWNDKATAGELALGIRVSMPSVSVLTLSGRVAVRHSVLVQSFARFNAKTMLDVEIW